MPFFKSKYDTALICRVLMLNCLTQKYDKLWSEIYCDNFKEEQWSVLDKRLNNAVFESLRKDWKWGSPLRTDFERRMALVEIDVLTGMALGLTCEELKLMYTLQFSVLQSYENDTWYDCNGRIVFTSNRSLTAVGFTRSEWEADIKDAPAGKKFYRTITDDTMPGGPIERTIEYVAPFDRCNREEDYETAWRFFEEKYGKVN